MDADTLHLLKTSPQIAVAMLQVWPADMGAQLPMVGLSRKGKKRARARAANARPLLVSKQGGKCYWCGRRIIDLRNIPVEKVLKRFADTVRFVGFDGKPVDMLFATADHVRPLSQYTRLEKKEFDVVASCRPCNAKRNKSLPKERVCKRCGGELAGLKRRRHCKNCFVYYAMCRAPEPSIDDFDWLWIDLGGESA